MNFHWARSNKFLLVLLVISVAIVGVLTTLVIYPQHDQSTVDREVHLRAAPTVPAARVPAGANILATPNAATRPHAATTPNTANASVEPASQPPASPAPQGAPTPITPALVAPAPRLSTPPQLARSHQTPLKPKTSPYRRVTSVPAPPPPAAQPVNPAPQTDPDTPTRSSTPAKPGSPDGW
jgi:hypothetical protein